MLNKKQKQLVADKLADTGNYVLTGLVIAELTLKSRIPIVLMGILLYILTWILALKVIKRI